MKPKRLSSIISVALLAIMLSALAACVPAQPIPQTGVEPTLPAGGEPPAVVIAGLEPEDILVQLDYEPGFTLPEFRFPFGLNGLLGHLDSRGGALGKAACSSRRRVSRLRRRILQGRPGTAISGNAPTSLPT